MGQNIILVGFMGSGKSVAAKELAKRYDMREVSTDDLIESREGCEISQIFEEKGEAYFREVEDTLVEEVAALDNSIVDCGGGVFLKEKNIEMLNSAGISIYLKASADQVLDRTKGLTHRPLLNVENPKERIEELLNKRASFYERAHHTIDTDNKTNDRVCDEIGALLDRD